MERSNQPLVRLMGITKWFGPTLANDAISLDLMPGRVRGLLGENGAGKTTLMEILYGLYTRDAGEIYLRGQRVEIRSPRDAIGHGIGMVHQHSMVIPALTVAENVLLGTNGRWVIDYRAANSTVESLCSEFHSVLNGWDAAGELGPGQRQRIEVLRILHRGADVLVLDEPTARLTPGEVAELARIIRRVVERDGAVMLVTHKLDEVMTLCDDVTVLRGGRKVADLKIVDTSPEQLAALMIGKPGRFDIRTEPREGGDVALRLASVSVVPVRSGPSVLDDVSLAVREGEIVGIAGVDGNGQRELLEVIVGLTVPSKGSIEICGRDATELGAAVRARLGLGCIPSDRREEGVVASLSVAENLMLRKAAKAPLSRQGVLRKKPIRAFARDLVKRFGIRPQDASVAAGVLSGGNQQKTIIARELERSPKVLVVHQPTAGLDLEAVRQVYSLLLDARAQGAAIVLMSNELSELLAVSDRVTVIARGKLSPLWRRDQVDLNRLGLAMGGVDARQESNDEPKPSGASVREVSW
jgi:general nucleoside transport system ATP-binding protein